ncbi:hypothetical protein ACWEKM_39405 [Streptomyces sp. NPDC004752]
MRAELRSITDTLNGRIDVAIEPRLSSPALTATAFRIERLAQPVRVPIVPNLNAAAVRRVLFGLERLTRSLLVDIRPQLDDAAARGALDELTRDRHTLSALTWTAPVWTGCWASLKMPISRAGTGTEDADGPGRSLGVFGAAPRRRTAARDRSP